MEEGIFMKKMLILFAAMVVLLVKDAFW